MKILAAIVGMLAVLGQTPSGTLQKLIVNVNDAQGRFVQGMGKDDFTIEEDGVEQKIASFANGSDTPVTIGILVDKSNSMRLPLNVEGQKPVPAALLIASGVGRVFVHLMKEQDEFMLMTFDEGVKVKVNFTQDRTKVEDQLKKLNEVGGSTHLYESVLDALDNMKKAKYRKRALIVITDAYDTSGKEIDELKKRLAESETPVYTFGLRAVWEGRSDQNLSTPLFQMVLDTLGRNSGGISMVVNIPEYNSDQTIQALAVFAQIVTMDLRGQYTLSYYTSKPNPTQASVLRVKTKAPNLRVRIRRDALDPLAPTPQKK
jgi:Ca-activated chloride channel family protein